MRKKTTIGKEIVEGFQDLLRRMHMGRPIQVTEVRRVLTPSGRVMVVEESKEVVFGGDDVQEETKTIRSS